MMRMLLVGLLAALALLGTGAAVQAVVMPEPQYSRFSRLELLVPAGRWVGSELQQQLTETADIWRQTPAPQVDGYLEVHVLLNPAQLQQWLPALLQTGAAYLRMLDADIQELVDAEQARLQSVSAWSPDTSNHADFFDDFRPLAEHRALLNSLVSQYPDLVTLSTIGKSIEGEDIIVATVTAPSAQKDASGMVAGRPGMLVQSGTHAREWLATPFSLFLLKRLAEGWQRDPAITKLLDTYNWYLVTAVNPDGYKHTWTSGARLWRKNRRRNQDGSYGVDQNRNMPGSPFCGTGGSRSPNSETYCGTGPASEPEVQAVYNFAKAHPEIKATFDMHTYSQLMLYPWQHTYDKLPADKLAEFRKQGSEMQRVMRGLYGVNYDPIQGSDLYPHPGSAVDAMWDLLGSYSYTFEGRGNNFIISPDNIKPACEEQTQAIFWLANWLAGKSE